MESIWIEVVLIAVAIVANGFFSGSEIALVSARPSRLAQLRGERVPGAARAEALKRDPEHLSRHRADRHHPGGDAGLGGRRRHRGGSAEPWLAEPAGPRRRPLGGGQSRSGAVIAPHHLRLAGHRRAHAEGARAAQSRGVACARGAGRSPGWCACSTRPSRLLTWSTRIVLIVLGQRDAAAGAAGLGGGGQVSGPRGRVPRRVRAAGERARPARLPVHRHPGAPRHDAAAQHPRPSTSRRRRRRS